MSIVHPAVDSKLSDSILCQRHKVFWEDKKEKTLNYIKRPGSVIKEKRERSRNERNWRRRKNITIVERMDEKTNEQDKAMER